MKKFHILLMKEIKDLFTTKTALIFLILSSWLTGYSFLTAVDLYSEQSQSAVGDLLYASGFEPAPGIFTPTFGGLFVLFSIFLPFVVITLITLEKERGTLTLLAQLPYTFGEIVLAKALASALFVLTSVSMIVPCAIAWNLYGGHIPTGELSTLFLGYTLLGIFIVSISFFAAALFNGFSAAAICAVFLISSSWIIDFGASINRSPLLSFASDWTATTNLKYFENGIISFNAIFLFLSVTLLLFLISHTLLRFDIKSKWKIILSSLLFFIIVIYAASFFTFNIDVTESQRNSFSPEIVQSLRKVPKFEIDVYLTPGDSRFRDYKKTFIDKLFLLRNDIKIKMMGGCSLSKNYGLFVYKIGNRSLQTYSNSEEEIFPLIFKLAGLKRADNTAAPQHYCGYPLVLKTSLLPLKIIYFLLIPLILLATYLFNAKLTPRKSI